MYSQHVYGKEEDKHPPLTSTEPVLPTPIGGCEHGHVWQPTIILGYFQCGRCQTLAVCGICVSKRRGKPLVGVCRQHQHLRSTDTHQEVLA
jgi:hypothetical protein